MIAVTPARGDADRAADPHGRTAEIRRAAGALFLAKGYTSTTMNDIARSVGILPGSLYHHFSSKEAVAIEMLDALNDDLRILSTDLRRSGHLSLPPEDRLRELCTSVVRLSSEHAAAVRLRAFDPPTVSSDRFREAVALQPVGLQRLWRSAANALRDQLPQSPVNPYLLTHALQRLTATSATSLPAPLEADEAARVICDSLLYGLAPGCRDEDLDASAPLAAAKKSVSAWFTTDAGTDELTRQILNGARREFARRGYDATTIRDIVEASGVRMGSIYRRVSSMEAIFEEIVSAYSDRIEQGMTSVLNTPSDSVAATIDALAYVVVHAKRRYPEETTMMSLERHLSPEGRPEFLSRYRDQSIARVAHLGRILEQGQQEGSLSPICAPTQLASYVRNILWITSPNHGRISARTEHQFLREHLLRGVVPVASRSHA